MSEFAGRFRRIVENREAIGIGAGRANGPGAPDGDPLRAWLDARGRAVLPSVSIMGQGLVSRESAA